LKAGFGAIEMSSEQKDIAEPDQMVRKILMAAIALCLVLQLIMVFRFEINQDEFYNLSMGYEFLRGEVGTPFQTLMFRMSGWLRFLPGNEIDHIIAGRVISYCAAIITVILIYLTSRRYFGSEASLLAVLVFFGFNYVFRHLTAFRTDILVTMCLMATVWFVSDPKQSWRKVISAGLLIGMAFTLSLKSIFYMPIIAVFLIGRWINSQWAKREFLYGLGMLAIAVISYVIIFILHDPQIQTPEQSTTYLKTISGTSFFEGGLFNNWGFLVDSLIFNFLGWMLLALGFVVTIGQLKDSNVRPKIETLGLLAFIIPLTPVVYYFHANPYFFPFMLAPAVIFIAAAIDPYLKKNKSPIFTLLVCVISVLPMLAFARSLPQNQTAQRTLVNAVHDIFPTSVPVVDYCGMISSFDRLNEVGLFINPDIFAHSKYLKSGKPMMTEFIKDYQPQIFLANVIRLKEGDDAEEKFLNELLEQDAQVLKNNYTKFWGPIYVPGKSLDRNGQFEILVSGTYTYYGTENATIDKIVVSNGQSISLPQGPHLVNISPPANGQLVWGDNLQKPDGPAPTKPLFNGF